MRLRFLSLALVGFILLVGSRCFATAFNLWVDDSNGNIFTVNTSTGAVSGIVNTGISGGLSDIAFSPSGVLYGITYQSSQNLYTINTATGAVTLVGSLGVGGLNALTFGTNGVLYSANGSDLYTLDPTRGTATLVGPIGFSSAGDVAFVNGTLYMSATNGDLVSINLTTGAGTSVGDMGIDNMYGLASPGNGTLYGIAGTTLYTIDPSNGTATPGPSYSYSGMGGGYARGSAFISEAVPSTTPEPASLLLVGTGLLGLGWLARRELDGHAPEVTKRRERLC